MKHIFLAVIMVFTAHNFFAQNQQENNWSAGRPDGHAPISVMGDHLHGKGEWMISYRYVRMNMENLIKTTNKISHAEVFENYMVTPEKMTMNMHMLGIMYAPSDKVTLMLMTNAVQNDMNLHSHMAGDFTTKSSGLGDLKVSAMYQFFNKNRQSLHAQLGFSIPTGNIEQRDVTPASAPDEAFLPYPMQIGSGTLDLEPALTYLLQGNLFSFGSQLKAGIRIGKNTYEYRLGNKYSLNNWLGIKLNDWLSFSGRIQGGVTEKIEGEHTELMPMMIPAANTQNSGGKWVHSGVGINTYIPQGALKNLRLGIEYTFPIYQEVNGIQLSNQENVSLGLQYSFH